jgi:glutamate-1-semialdehyde aminotransferase
MDPSNPRDREALEARGVSVDDISRLNMDFMGHDRFGEVPAVARQIGSTWPLQGRTRKPIAVASIIRKATMSLEMSLTTNSGTAMSHKLL